MLLITDSRGTHPWHVGEVWPRLEGRIVRLQADGHELMWLDEVFRACAPLSSKVALKGHTLMAYTFAPEEAEVKRPKATCKGCGQGIDRHTTDGGCLDVDYAGGQRWDFETVGDSHGMPWKEFENKWVALLAKEKKHAR